MIFLRICQLSTSKRDGLCSGPLLCGRTVFVAVVILLFLVLSISLTFLIAAFVQTVSVAVDQLVHQVVKVLVLQGT